jgi:glycine/D-amino acid oxidase-like deaminating enzyme
MRRRLDGGYTLAVRGRGVIELTPQGLRYGLKFLPMYRARRNANSPIRIGKSFFQGPGAIARWKADSVSPFEKDRVFDPPSDQAVIDAAMAAVIETYPALAGIKVAHSWGGWIDSTPDAIPVISGVDAIPGLFLATGFSGHGFGIGPGAGRLAADLVAGDAPVVDPTPFRYARLFDGTSGSVAGM